MFWIQPFSIIPLPLATSPLYVKELTWMLCIPHLNIVQTECVGGCSALECRTYGFPFWHPGCALFWDETTDTANHARQPAASSTVTQACQPSTRKSLHNAGVFTYIKQHKGECIPLRPLTFIFPVINPLPFFFSFPMCAAVVGESMRSERSRGMRRAPSLFNNSEKKNARARKGVSKHQWVPSSRVILEPSVLQRECASANCWRFPCRSQREAFTLIRCRHSSSKELTFWLVSASC